MVLNYHNNYLARSFLITIAITLLSSVYAKAQPQKLTGIVSRYYWLELENHHTYRNNDFYIKKFNDYGFSTTEVRIGFRVFNLWSSVAFEPYIKGSYIIDFFDQQWNRVDWHNNYIYGTGLRLRAILKNIKFVSRHLNPHEFNLDLFLEHLWIDYPLKTEFYIGHRPRDDFKTGVQVWLDLGHKYKSDAQGQWHRILNWCWLESASSFHYAKNSFYARTQQGFYLFSLNNKIGARVRIMPRSFCEPYGTIDLIYDLGEQTWNQLDWHNNIHYGGGIRFKFYRHLEYQPGMTNCIVGPYFEYLFSRYFEKAFYVPSYRPKTDWRAGIQLWISINGEKI